MALLFCTFWGLFVCGAGASGCGLWLKGSISATVSGLDKQIWRLEPQKEAYLLLLEVILVFQPFFRTFFFFESFLSKSKDICSQVIPSFWSIACMIRRKLHLHAPNETKKCCSMLQFLSCKEQIYIYITYKQTHFRQPASNDYSNTHIRQRSIDYSTEFAFRSQQRGFQAAATFDPPARSKQYVESGVNQEGWHHGEALTGHVNVACFFWVVFASLLIPFGLFSLTERPGLKVMDYSCCCILLLGLAKPSWSVCYVVCSSLTPSAFVSRHEPMESRSHTSNLPSMSLAHILFTIGTL